MLFPQNYLTIPFLSLFFNKMLALQPIMKALAVLFAEPFLLFDSQYVVPSHLPTLMNQFQTTEPSISQQCALSPLQIRCDLLEEGRDNLPLPPIPFLFLWHNTPCYW